VIDAFDVRRVLSLYGLRADNPNFNAAFDRNADGMIDAFDVRVVLALYGQPCG
jgi:hypothetical protein